MKAWSLDGWVLARSAFHHSAHYRSAVVFGQFNVIEENAEKDRLLNHFIEQIAPGRTEQVRLSNEKELNATELLAIGLEEASVKISAFGVNDDSSDLDRPVWAGILPYRTVVGPWFVLWLMERFIDSSLIFLKGFVITGRGIVAIVLVRDQDAKSCPTQMAIIDRKVPA